MTDVAAIKRAVSEFYHLPVDILCGESRQASVAHPRQVAMVLARELTTNSLVYIGQQFGRDHTTVLHALGAVRDRCNADPKLFDQIEKIRQSLEGRPDFRSQVASQLEACRAIASALAKELWILEPPAYLRERP